MGDNEVDAEAAKAGANSYYIWRNGVWQVFDTGSFKIGNRDAQLMVVQGGKLVLVERDQALRILRSEEGLRYVPLHVKKKEPELSCRRLKKPKKKKNKMEPLLHELNSHMALMNKILMRQWMDSAKNSGKDISENNSTPDPVEPVKNIAVSAVVHETPATPEPIQSASTEIPIAHSSKSTSEEQRRHMRTTLQKVQNLESDGFATDSSAADFELQPVNPKIFEKGETAKRKKTAPNRVSKRLKSDSSQESLFLPSSSSNSSDDKPKRLPSPKAAKDHDKENLKRRKTRSQASITSEDDKEHDKKLPVVKSKMTTKDSKPLKQHRVLRTANASKISKNESTQHAGLRSLSNSPGKSPLKRPDLEGVIEADTSTIIAKQTQIKRLGEVSPTKSTSSHKKPTKINKTEGSQSLSKKLNASSNTSIKLKTYSMLEDQAILDYILKDNNSRLVKGTLMWKTLQKVFYSMTNQSRTWQSLKNRYLNYIMPDLKYYGLTYDKEKLLRTGQYLGEITRKKKTSKENSIFKTQPVASASNALRFKNKPKTSVPEEPGPSTSRGTAPVSSTPKSEPRARGGDPTYSEVTRRYLRRRPRTSSDEETPARPTRKLYNPNA